VVPVSAQDKISEFLDKPKNFLVFCGNPGIGKTYFCASLVEWAMINFNSFRYWNESELLKRLRSSIEDFKGDYLEALKLLIDDDFVMIDDIGSTGLNDWRKEVIFDAIDERYNTMLPTVITSNFSRQEFERNFHPRLSSRLFAAENTVIEILDGQDLRK
jgi:DNA replication protein DnaC